MNIDSKNRKIKQKLKLVFRERTSTTYGKIITHQTNFVKDARKLLIGEIPGIVGGPVE
ncbi:MAG: hypothetical protein KAR20_17870 [Candidatus Heimdallarchaeota archaeon]|nr:hypothetical protein [Candidatus Heimdallarchaeota archaeon]